MAENLGPTLMKMQGTLTFTAEGSWLHEGEPVTHPGISRYFTTHLQYDAVANRYLIVVDNRAVEVVVEDTPRVARTLHLVDTPPQVTYNDAQQEAFRPETLVVTDAHVFYLRTQGGELTRIHKDAAAALYPYIEETDEQGGFMLALHGKRFPIMQCTREELQLSETPDRR